MSEDLGKFQRLQNICTNPDFTLDKLKAKVSTLEGWVLDPICMPDPKIGILVSARRVKDKDDSCMWLLIANESKALHPGIYCDEELNTVLSHLNNWLEGFLKE